MLYRFFNSDLLSPSNSKSVVVVLVSKRIRVRTGILELSVCLFAFCAVGTSGAACDLRLRKGPGFRKVWREIAGDFKLKSL